MISGWSWQNSEKLTEPHYILKQLDQCFLRVHLSIFRTWNILVHFSQWYMTANVMIFIRHLVCQQIWPLWWSKVIYSLFLIDAYLVNLLFLSPLISKVIEIVKRGGRPDLAVTLDIFPQYKALMHQCWNSSPDNRPKFKQVRITTVIDISHCWIRNIATNVASMFTRTCRLFSIVVTSSKYVGNFGHRSNLAWSFEQVFLRFTDSSKPSQFVN